MDLITVLLRDAVFDLVDVDGIRRKGDDGSQGVTENVQVLARADTLDHRLHGVVHVAGGLAYPSLPIAIIAAQVPAMMLPGREPLYPGEQ